MGKKTRSFLKKELDGTPWIRYAMAFKFGKYDQDIWGIAGAFKGCKPLDVGIDIITAIRELIKLMAKAAKNSDGEKLRQLADAIEQQNKSGWHDPLGRYFLKVKGGIYPFSEELAKKTGKQGLSFKAMEKPKTAQEIQDEIRDEYPKDALPTLKTIRERAIKEFDVTLPKDKSGANPGVKRKSQNRARR